MSQEQAQPLVESGVDPSFCCQDPMMKRATNPQVDGDGSDWLMIPLWAAFTKNLARAFRLAGRPIACRKGPRRLTAPRACALHGGCANPPGRNRMGSPLCCAGIGDLRREIAAACLRLWDFPIVQTTLSAGGAASQARKRLGESTLYFLSRFFHPCPAFKSFDFAG